MPNHSKRVFAFVLLAGMLIRPANGQTGWVEVETNHPEAFVYADTTWLGTASTGLFQIPAGAHQLILTPNTVDSWSVSPLSVPLAGLTKDTLRIELNFPYVYRIESIPSDVDVYLAADGVRSFIGSTPVEHVSATQLTGELVFDRADYLSRSVSPGAELWNRHLVLLESVEQMDPIASSGVKSLRSSTHWLDYIAIGTTITGALLAVHYKTKADRLYDEYKESRDIGLKPDIDQFDLYSGVALGAMQVGLGVLAFRLIF